MTAQEFFDSLVRLYQQARIPTFESSAIRRGRCRAVSGALEDLLASLIVLNHSGRYLAFVDQYVNLGTKPVMYVDVLLYDKAVGQVTHFIDAKTDLGWSSEGLEALCKHFRQQVKRATQVKLKLVDQDGAETACAVSPSAQCHIVIATRVNGRGLTPERISGVERDLGVSIFVLSDGEHPNAFSRSAEAHYPAKYIAQSEFTRLHAALR
jgi:hypothetical protein